MPTIPQRELRNNSGEVLRRAAAGETFTVTVNGRPVAELRPLPGSEVPLTLAELATVAPPGGAWPAEILAMREDERDADRR